MWAQAIVVEGLNMFADMHFDTFVLPNLGSLQQALLDLGNRVNGRSILHTESTAVRAWFAPGPVLKSLCS
jgi:hypothetical protein